MDGRRGRIVQPAMSRPLSANRSQMLLLPPCLDDFVPPQHPVRFVAEFVDALPLADMGFKVPDPESAGAPAYAPTLLLSVWVYGWMDRVRTSRRLEAACLRDVTYMWIAGGLHPDHNTLWRFFRDNKKALKAVFRKVVHVAVASDLVGFALHAVDGTKIQCASSTDTTWHRQKLNEKLKRLDEVINEQMVEAERNEQVEDVSFAMPEQLRDREQLRNQVREALAAMDQADADHLHPAEPEAQMMKLRGGQNALSYNAQAVVDHDSDLIIAEDVVSDGSDNAQLVPMTQQVLDNTGQVAGCTLGDGGYRSGEQLFEAEARNFPVLVNMQEEAETKGSFAKSNFRYDQERDGYVCPLGEFLPFSKFTQNRGASEKLRVYRCRNKQCPQRDKCTSDKVGRTIRRSAYDETLRRHRELVEMPQNKLKLSLRKEIIEHAFGVIKSNNGFRRFSFKGLAAASACWTLACTAFDLWKLYPHWVQGRLAMAV